MEYTSTARKLCGYAYNVKCLLMLILFSHYVSPFNIQNIHFGKVIVAEQAKSQFGYSVSFHENSRGKWLMVGAPKEHEIKVAARLSNEAAKNDTNESKSSDGAIHLCKMNEDKITNSTCTKVLLKSEKRKEVIYSCDFENCRLEQLQDDDFDWTPSNSGTPSDTTGPSHDHTFETRNTSGFYMFIESSKIPGKKHYPGESAIIATSRLQGTVGDCLRFWYHMYGKTVLSLNVYVQSNQTGMVMIWSKDSDQGDMWNSAYVTVISMQPYKILFEATKDEWKGDIGIDDIEISKGQCPEDINMEGQSVGATLTRNPDTGEILTCAPKWKYNCSGQIHSSGVCYKLNKNLSANTMSILAPCRTQVCSTGQIDLVFLIDGSHSVSNADFIKIQHWLKNVVSSLPISIDHIQVGVLVYTHVTNIHFYLNEYDKVDELRKAIRNMSFEGGNTKTGKAIDVATTEMFREEHGMRPNAKHVAIVMTDGKSQDDVVQPSIRAKNNGITMFAIGVGNANVTELRAISSESNKTLFTIKDYSALNEIRKSLQDSITALESQGKASTREYGQAGISATFYNNCTIMGAPGLEDWSGGYSTDYVNDNNPEVPRILTTFRGLLQTERNKFISKLNKPKPQAEAIKPSQSKDHVSLFSPGDVAKKIPQQNAEETSMPAIEVTVHQKNNQTNNTSTSLSINSDIFNSMHVSSKSNETLARAKRQTETSVRSCLDFFVPQFLRGFVDVFLSSAMSSSTKRNATNSPAYTSTTIKFSNKKTKLDVGLGVGQNNSRSVDSAKVITKLSRANSNYLNYSISNDKIISSQYTDMDYRKRDKGQRYLSQKTNAFEHNEDNTELLAGKVYKAKSSEKVLQSINTHDGSSTLPNVIIKRRPSHNELRNKRSLKKSSSPAKKFSSNSFLSASEDIAQLYDHAYFGYAIATGRFETKDQRALAFGAPRSKSYGAAFIVKQGGVADSNIPRLLVKFESAQMGSYFGFSLCAADLNGDGLDELIVGAPLWMEKHEDEGRVFAFLSDFNKHTAKVTRRELILSGNRKAGSRFGYSLASPGDLNKDGYEDIVVGAPSNSFERSGSVYIYYGRPHGRTIADFFQVIRASERNEKLGYFGFSLDASVDIDGNGYNDLAIGSPADDAVVILRSRPVIHTYVEFFSASSLLDLAADFESEAFQTNNECQRNKTKLCTRLTACFRAYGLTIPENISLAYYLEPDINFNAESHPRGRIVASSGIMELYANQNVCKNFTLHLKLPVRHQLIPMVIQMKYELSDQMQTSSTSAVLDIFDATPKSAIIQFATMCQNSTCLSDLQVECGVKKEGITDQSLLPTIIVEYDRLISINVNLTNHIDAAYDVEIKVVFDKALFLMQVVPLHPNEKACIERTLESEGIQVESVRKTPENKATKDESDSRSAILVLKEPVLMKNQTCLMKMQFGIQKEYNGGNLNFTFRTKSNSSEIQPQDDYCQLTSLIQMKTKISLNGLTDEDTVSLSSLFNENFTSLDNVAPVVKHSYRIFNAGPSRLPNASIEVKWPEKTATRQNLFLLWKVKCIPAHLCVFHDLGSLIETFRINNTIPFNVSDNQQKMSHVETNAESILDQESDRTFTHLEIDCSEKDKREHYFCKSLHCNVHGMESAQTLELQLFFRLLKKTFVQKKVWRTSITSEVIVSTEPSPYLVGSDGKNGITKRAKVKTWTVNDNFTRMVDDDGDYNFNWWIVVISIAAGFLVLLIAILVLRKLGFFRSKYKEQLEDEMQWTNGYKYTVARQSEEDIINEECGTANKPSSKLTTFQGNKKDPSSL